MLTEEKEKAYLGGTYPDGAKIYLQVENREEEGPQLDLVNVAFNMSKRRRIYRYLFAVAACAGVFAALLWIGVGQLVGNASYAQAVITFQYEGIEDGLDPNGAALDVNKLKSPAVIERALSDLGFSAADVERIRENITIEGVVPEDAVERITVIREMALEEASNYEKILDVSYFPSQYVISLYQARGMSADETREILNAVLESYKTYFLDTYANTELLTVTGNLIQYQDYDYAESVDTLQSQVDMMMNYVTQRHEQAPDFRSVETGLSFGDIAASLETIESIDMANLSSYIESKTLTKDRERQIEYFNYKIRKYTMELSELQVQLTTVQNTLDSYVKDPVVIVSSQESTQEITQSSEYYDTLIQRKLELSGRVASVNTELNRTYEQLSDVSGSMRQNVQEEYDRADEMLSAITEKLSQWIALTEKTTQEYYSTTLFSNAVRVAVPAQYRAAGGIVEAAKKGILCVAALVLLTAVIWGLDGMRMELATLRGAGVKERSDRTG